MIYFANALDRSMAHKLTVLLPLVIDSTFFINENDIWHGATNSFFESKLFFISIEVPSDFVYETVFRNLR